ncbi:hypothetical protein EUGRSUZ_G01713 [Eucalyptus grandis]|uniref:Uncharacterized protein n=2 Tax=Eucalyptus grandis TaxID=71139 RepID=A0ACC3K3U7_EUCGR|nr:hypothetical protein EUGRSUZ_G01713 [Eucalyptus grandis]
MRTQNYILDFLLPRLLHSFKPRSGLRTWVFILETSASRHRKNSDKLRQNRCHPNPVNYAAQKRNPRISTRKRQKLKRNQMRIGQIHEDQGHGDGAESMNPMRDKTSPEWGPAS